MTPRSRSATRSSMLRPSASRSQPSTTASRSSGVSSAATSRVHGRLQRGAEVVEHVRHPALAAGQVEGQHRARGSATAGRGRR